MLDFITIPLIVGIVTLGIYKLFELFARKKERMALIEKLGDKLNPEILDTKISFPLRLTGDKTFGTLKVGSLSTGDGTWFADRILSATFIMAMPTSTIITFAKWSA